MVETLGQVTDTVNVSPRKRVWELVGRQVGMRKRALEIVVDGIVTDLQCYWEMHMTQLTR